VATVMKQLKLAASFEVARRVWCHMLGKIGRKIVSEISTRRKVYHSNISSFPETQEENSAKGIDNCLQC
jgi:hypothetical protein